MAIRRRPNGQHRECFPARRASTAANPDPIVPLIVRLFASPPMPDDRLLTAEWTSPGEQMQRDRGLGLALRLWQCDKENHGWREGLPLKRTLPGIDLVTGLHPPGKSVRTKTEYCFRTLRVWSIRIGRYKRTLRKLLHRARCQQRALYGHVTDRLCCLFRTDSHGSSRISSVAQRGRTGVACALDVSASTDNKPT